ncbi:hypothetical protein [Domibacillus epiphyticus]|uniref:Uncharacterized protein n=1 Tax=Domibacillus epiphyticus TaxID=1714355 RepID=A0A1V2A6D6_9BACI|nr:hypothetical protein [Domibacillus epiphyticus]OMP66384.1 hypothetical protein BTO28_13075 [Domibacillus epiphyticus]
MTTVTDEDIKIIHDYIIQNLTIRSLQRELKDVETSNDRMKRFYISANQYQESQALKELKELRKEMNKRGLRIVGEHSAVNGIIEFRYLCRGVPSNLSLQDKELNKLIEEKRFELLR